jgi:siroheme synthase
VFVTPRVGEAESPRDWAAIAIAADTAVLYMGVGEAAGVAATLLARGKSAQTPVIVVESATLPEARAHHGTLENLAALAARVEAGPALIFMGEVLRQRNGGGRLPAGARAAA